MTRTQHEHHQEAMEAARRDFQALWATRLLPRIQSMSGPKSKAALDLLRDITWNAFHEGRHP